VAYGRTRWRRNRRRSRHLVVASQVALFRAEPFAVAAGG
jgi:hypothetical protein